MSENELKLERNLDDIESSLLKSISQPNCDISCIKNRYLAAVDAYIQVIKDFFSTQDGEGAKIHHMYQATKDLSKTYGKIKVFDADHAMYTYKEYYQGMLSFLDNNISLIGNSDDSQQCDKIKEIGEKDGLFIDSLFVGRNARELETSIYDGVSNLEVLIDFVTELRKAKDYMSETVDKITSLGHYDNIVAKELLIFYCQSTIRFSTRLIKSIFDSYVTLRKSLCSGCCSDEVYQKLQSYSGTSRGEKVQSADGLRLF